MTLTARETVITLLRKQSEPMTTRAVASETGLKLSTVRTTLNNAYRAGLLHSAAGNDQRFEAILWSIRT